MARVKPQLLIVSQVFYPEPVATGQALTELAEELTAKGLSVAAIAAQPTTVPGAVRAPGVIEHKGILIRRTWSTRLPKTSAIGKLINLITFFLSALWLVLTKYPRAQLLLVTNPPYLPLLGWLCHLVRGQRFGVVLHDILPEQAELIGFIRPNGWLAKAWRRCNALWYRRASYVIALSPEMVEGALKNANLLGSKHEPECRAKTKVIHIWCDDRLIVPRPKSESTEAVRLGVSDRFVVQYSGNHGRFHDIETLWNVAQSFSAGDGFLFQFIGEGQKKKLVDQRLNSINLAHVYSSGYVDKELLPDSLAMADLGVVAQLPGQERVCYPSKLLGIMGSGRATLAICPPTCDMARMVREQQIGFVVPNGDVAGARQVLLEAKANPELLRKMGHRAAHYVREHLSLARAAQGYFDLISSEPSKGDSASKDFGPGCVTSVTHEQMKCAVIFGGTGYVGTNWARLLARKAEFQRMILADLHPPGSPLVPGTEFCLCDVRKPIDKQLNRLKPDWIFNFAAVHREPGHKPAEYFDTNLPGANHVCEFADATGCSNILFTSSISVYGPTRDATTECSPTHPSTPYGVSKLCAELIHEKWLQGSVGRRLIICRPGVIYGPGDPGNILRMIRAIQRGYFFFPGSTNIRKSYGYIEGLLESFEFAMARSERCLRFNYVEERTETIGELVRIIRQELGCSAPVISCPLWILQPLAQGLQFVSHGRSPIHPARVRKAATPTHIVPQRLEELGFRFRFDFRSSLDDWQARAPQDFGLRKPASQPASWIGAT